MCPDGINDDKIVFTDPSDWQTKVYSTGLVQATAMEALYTAINAMKVYLFANEDTLDEMMNFVNHQLDSRGIPDALWEFVYLVGISLTTKKIDYDAYFNFKAKLVEYTPDHILGMFMRVEDYLNGTEEAETAIVTVSKNLKSDPILLWNTMYDFFIQ